MSLTVVTSASPVGAGRIIDCSVDLNTGNIGNYTTTFTSATRAAFCGRLTGSSLSYGGTAGITNSGTNSGGTQKDRFCNRYGAAAPGSAGFFTSPVNMIMPIVQPVHKLEDDAQINNMRFIFTMCRTGITAQAFPNDCGISFAPNTAQIGNIFVSSAIQQVGFGVFYDGAGDLWWASRPTLLPVNSLPPDAIKLTTDGGLDWHEIEFRFQSAQLGADATVNVIVDGVDTITRNWGVGTLLPTAASAGLSTIFGFGLMGGHSAASIVDAMYLSQIRFVAASTFSAMF
jgi:hypothetical protein